MGTNPMILAVGVTIRLKTVHIEKCFMDCKYEIILT